MTNAELNAEFERKTRTLQEMFDQEMIDQELYDRLIERVKNETFFGISVLADIASLPTAA